MNVLITGIGGRIGSMLTEQLRACGHQVRGFDIRKPSSVQLDDFVAGDLLDADSIRNAIDGINGVVHLAAFMSWHPKDTNKLFEINVTGTYNLLNALRNTTLDRFVFASSGEIYPELNPAYLPIDEAHPTLPTSPYGMTKYLGEQLVKNIGEQTGLPYCILRFAHTQAASELIDPNNFFSGPRFHVNAKIRQLESFPSSTAIENSIAALKQVATTDERLYIGCNPDGQPYRMGICDVRDLIQGIALGLEHDQAIQETFNIGPTSSIDFDKLITYMSARTGMAADKVVLETAPYRYDTTIEKAVRILGYAPQFDVFRMIDEATA